MDVVGVFEKRLRLLPVIEVSALAQGPRRVKPDHAHQEPKGKTRCSLEYLRVAQVRLRVGLQYKDIVYAGLTAAVDHNAPAPKVQDGDTRRPEDGEGRPVVWLLRKVVRDECYSEEHDEQGGGEAELEAETAGHPV